MLRWIRALGSSLFTGAISTVAMAGSFDNVGSNGHSFGKISKNVATEMLGTSAALDAFLYLAGISFFWLFLMKMKKHYENNFSHEGSKFIVLYLTYLAASVFCFAAPTLLGGGLSTLFGNGQVQTTRPTASFAGS